MAIEFKPIGTYVLTPKKRGNPKSEYRLAMEEMEEGQEFYITAVKRANLNAAANLVSKLRGIRISVRKSGDGYAIQAHKKDKK